MPTIDAGNNRTGVARGVFYVVRMYPLLGNGRVSVLWSDPSPYNEKPTITNSSYRVDTGTNTSTEALRVVGGNEKGTECLGV
jgi:hypothetical protein